MSTRTDDALPPRAPGPRPDLDRRTLFVMLAAVGVGIVLALFLGRGVSPGAPVRQGIAALGAALLLVPVAFAFTKRSGLASSPPAWFVAHVLSSALGAVLVFFHAAGGSMLSPPALLLLALVFLVLQGVIARAFLAFDLAHLFASKPASFERADPTLREKLRALIEDKRVLLARLDPHADEALFSPNLHHWRRRPVLTWRYTRLAAREAALVGARAQAGLALATWRRLHMAVAWLFVGGLFVHVVLVTFFAGYVADGGPIDWWHLAAWGSGW